MNKIKYATKPQTANEIKLCHRGEEITPNIKVRNVAAIKSQVNVAASSVFSKTYLYLKKARIKREIPAHIKLSEVALSDKILKLIFMFYISIVYYSI